MSDAYPAPRVARFTLGVLLLAYTLSFVDRQILSLMVGPIRHDLGITDFRMSLLQGMAFALFYVVLGIPIGRLADRSNRKRIIAVGVLLWSVMTAACGIARSFSELFLARMGVGVGEATLSPSAYSLLSDTFPPARLARATAIFTMGITVGSGIAYMIGGSVIKVVAQMGMTHLPLVGTVAPWQAAFFIVGIPGILVGLLVLAIREPLRRGVRPESAPSETVPMREVLRTVRSSAGAYSAIFGAISLLSILGYGYLNWYPTYLIRTFNLSAGEVGLKFGLIFLCFGSAGALASALMSEHLARRGYIDANLRTIVIVALGLVPFSLGPLMPTATLALVTAAPTVFLLSAFFGVSIAALQLITPNRMRAVISAGFLFATTLFGLFLGASAVAFCTDYVFHNDLALRYSLVVVGVVITPLAALISGAGLRSYRTALQSAVQWTS